MKKSIVRFKTWLIKKLGGIRPMFRYDISCEFFAINDEPTEHDIKNNLSKIIDKLYNENCFTMITCYDYSMDRYIVKIVLTAIKER